MSKISKSQKDCYFNGFTTQEEFRTAMEKATNLNWKWEFNRYAASNENKIEKWDQLWNVNGAETRLEVKGLKKQCRSGDFTDSTVLEIKGINGSKGFLYGEAELIAFKAVDNTFIIVPIQKLRDFVDLYRHVPVLIKLPHNVMPNKQIYYRVSQPQELCMFVKTAELVPLAAEVVKC